MNANQGKYHKHVSRQIHAERQRFAVRQLEPGKFHRKRVYRSKGTQRLWKC